MKLSITWKTLRPEGKGGLIHAFVGTSFVGTVCEEKRWNGVKFEDFILASSVNLTNAGVHHRSWADAKRAVEVRAAAFFRGAGFDVEV